MDDEVRKRLEALERNQRMVAGIIVLAVWTAGYQVGTRWLGMNPGAAMLTGAGCAAVTVLWLAARVRGL